MSYVTCRVDTQCVKQEQCGKQTKSNNIIVQIKNPQIAENVKI